MNIPNKLTIARVLAVPVFIILYLMDLVWPAAILYITACITDTLDGYLARKNNLISNFGKFMDPLADKILVYSAFCLFIADGSMPSWMLIVILAREFSVAGVRMIAASDGIVIPASVSGKIKTILQMIAVPVMIVDRAGSPLWFHAAAAVFLWASFVMTIISGAEYIYKNRHIFK